MIKRKRGNLQERMNKRKDNKDNKDKELTLKTFTNKPTCNLSLFRKNMYLEDVKIIGQFILNKKCLVTLISESHKNNIICDSNMPSMKIKDYCLLKKKNNNIKICLEYYDDVKDDELDKIGSVNIQQIATNDELKEDIIKYDIRRKYLTREEQDNLYNTYKLDIKAYIKIFEESYTDIIYNETENIVDIVFFTNFSKVIQQNFDRIKALGSSSINTIETINILRQSFAMITDYFLLKQIFMCDDSVNEYIVIAGDYHINNIIQNMINYDKIYIAYLEDVALKNQKCVNLHNSLFVTNE